MAFIHIPVLKREVVEWLAPKPGGIYIDGTLGGYGHSRLLAAEMQGSGSILGFDRDSLVIEQAPDELDGVPLHAIHASYGEAKHHLAEQGIEQVDGILLDLGLSSDQLADQDRGFSFESDGELDLRFDTSRGEPARRLVNRLSEKHLADVIYQYGEDRLSRHIAAAIVAARRSEEIVSATQLSDIVRRVVQRTKRKRGMNDERIHPATRTFQALRIAVNDELEILSHALRSLPDLLKPSGRFAIISFHSLEDRMVKTAFRDDPRLSVLTRRPVRPTDAEEAENPRSRSSRLRVAERHLDTNAQVR